MQNIINRVWLNDVGSSNDDVLLLLRCLGPWEVQDMTQKWRLCQVHKKLNFSHGRHLQAGDVVIGHNFDEDGMPMEAFFLWSPRTLTVVHAFEPHVGYL